MTKQEQMAKLIRQGDVVLMPVDSIPKDAKKLSGTVLQESETTGHHHHFKPTANVQVFETKEASSLVATITPDTGKFILVENDELLYHGKGFDPTPAKNRTGDHHALTVPAGNYQVIIKREYDYKMKAPKRVVD